MAALAVVVALLHLALVVWLVVGGPLSVRWPRLARWHLAALVPTAAVFLAGADCPLTVGEKALLRGAGRPVYEGGFIEHRLVEPLHPAGITPTIQLLIVAAWVVPTVVGHGLRLRRRRTRTIPSPDALDRFVAGAAAVGRLLPAEPDPSTVPSPAARPSREPGGRSLSRAG